jgi:hypothetical protein
VAWWKPLADKDDAEGQLVVGWLMRHRLVEDPDGRDFAERFKAARKGGWAVPDWMMEPSAGGSPHN